MENIIRADFDAVIKKIHKVDNELVNLWMGHSAGKNLTANTYTHFSMEFQKKQAKKISNY